MKNAQMKESDEAALFQQFCSLYRVYIEFWSSGIKWNTTWIRVSKDIRLNNIPSAHH
jgi:hypothetical protein